MNTENMASAGLVPIGHQGNRSRTVSVSDGSLAF